VDLAVVLQLKDNNVSTARFQGKKPELFELLESIYLLPYLELYLTNDN
jgi:hypothetical protein